MLWTTNTGAFNWWHFECTEIPWRDPEAHCCAIHPRPSPHVAAWYCTAPCCKDLYTIPGSWKHPSSCMASILTRHVTHWACLGCSGSAYTTACSSSCQYPATSHSLWRGVDQHSTGHNQQPDQLYVKEMCCTARGKWWSHQILTGFRTPPQYNKTSQVTYVTMVPRMGNETLRPLGVATGNALSVTRSEDTYEKTPPVGRRQPMTSLPACHNISAAGRIHHQLLRLKLASEAWSKA